MAALEGSTEKLMSSCALGITTSPPEYQSKSSAGLSSGWATKPSNDMHMWVKTLAMFSTTPRARRIHRNVRPELKHVSEAGTLLYCGGRRALVEGLDQSVLGERGDQPTGFIANLPADVAHARANRRALVV